MNLKNHLSFFAGASMLAVLFSITGCASTMPYTESRSGNYLYLNPLRHKPSSARAHWDYAVSLREQGSLRRAAREFDVLSRRWPDHPEAAQAKRAAADIYYEMGRAAKAFETYEALIDQYYTGIRNYDELLERKAGIAESEMSRKRMRWLFGGYRSPGRAVPLFESILKNAPRWERSAEMQYRIGEAHEKGGELELAVVAYSAVEFRYPDSPYAEQAAIARVRALDKLVGRVPYSTAILEEARLAARLFPELYPDSQHLGEVRQIAASLRDRAALNNYETGRFYERVPRPAREQSAVIYYQKTADEYGDTAAGQQAASRMRALLSTETVVADTTGVAPDPAVVGVEAAPGDAVAALRETPRTGPVITGELPPRQVEDEDAVEVTADRIEYVGDLLIAEGGVAVQQTGASLQADRVTVNPRTGEITAYGNVLMIREGIRWEGHELAYNYKTREGTFGESFMFFEPMFITARSSERVSANEYFMQDVTMTTCEGDNPILYAKAKEVRVLDEDKPSGVFIHAKQVTFYVGSVPVFYTPVWKRHLGYRLFTTTYGYGSRMGVFMQGSANYEINEWLRGSSHLDLYSKRGIGVGQDLKWLTSRGSGRIETYYINDREPYVKNYTAAERALIESRRYRVKAQHHEQLNEETYFMTQLNWVSDPGVIEEFFKEEFEREANPENYAVVQHATDSHAMGVRVDYRMNDFYTIVERLPMGTYDRYRARIGTTPFFGESENSAGYFGLRHRQLPDVLDPLDPETDVMEEDAARRDDYRAMRLDSYNRIFLPVRYDDFLNVIPRIGYRATWYSDSPAGSAELRHIVEAGALTSFKAHKMLTEKSSFFGDGMRHTVEPYADYLLRPEPNLRPDELYQFDSVDGLDRANEVRFGVRNFLQTKRGPRRITNFLDSDVYTTLRFDPEDGEDSFGPLVAYARMSITDSLFFQADGEFDLYSGELSPANFRVSWVAPDRSVLSASYRYRNDEGAERSLVSAYAMLFPDAKWSYDLGVRYDSRANRWEQRRILVKRKFDCIGAGLGFNVDKDDEIMLLFQLWLTAFPESAFGSGL